MEYADIFKAQLIQYRDLSSSIKQLIIKYEMDCSNLILCIKNKKFEDSQELFDKLHSTVELLSLAIYPYEFPVSDKIKDLIYHLDRDDIASRKYWYEKFKNGVTWPA